LRGKELRRVNVGQAEEVAASRREGKVGKRLRMVDWTEICNVSLKNIAIPQEAGRQR